MTEQEMNRHFQAIRTFIEQTALGAGLPTPPDARPKVSNPRHTAATATVLTRLDKLETKMLDMVGQQRATLRVTAKAA